MQNKITKKYPSFQNFFKKRLQGTFQQSEERKKKKEKGRRKKEKSKEN